MGGCRIFQYLNRATSLCECLPSSQHHPTVTHASLPIQILLLHICFPNRPTMPSRSSSKIKWWALVRARRTGIFHEDWPTIKGSVDGHSGAIYHSFKHERQAREWLDMQTERLSQNQTSSEENSQIPTATPELVANLKSLVCQIGSTVEVLEAQINSGRHQVRLAPLQSLAFL